MLNETKVKLAIFIFYMCLVILLVVGLMYNWKLVNDDEVRTKISGEKVMMAQVGFGTVVAYSLLTTIIILYFIFLETNPFNDFANKFKMMSPTVDENILSNMR